MPRGPKAKPTALKILDGTHREDRHGKPELEPGESLTQIPPPPKSLKAEGKKVWNELLPKIQNFITELDLREFEVYCQAFDEIKKYDAILKKGGEFFTTSKGYVCQHPATNQRHKWYDIRRRYAELFWLNPTSRSGKQVDPKSKVQKVRTRPRA